jgi:2-polyprenyl-3-methyl-5-hydroxy-6-metoxy-1,4-benzoquinol methylase
MAKFERSNCSLCGARGASVVYRNCRDRRHRLPGLFDLVRCDDCGLVRTDPRPSVGSIGEFYPPSYASFAAEVPRTSTWYAVLRAAVRLPYVLRYGPADPWFRPSNGTTRLLDIGCGSGVYLQAMANLGWSVQGVEPDAVAAARAAERLRVHQGRIFVGRVEEAEFSPDTFDLVTMGHVLEHFHDPRAVLEKVHRWLRPGGIVRLWVPNFESLESRVFRQLWFGLDVPRHLYHFGRRTICAILEVAGFNVTRVVPQYQANTLSGSISHALDALIGRQVEFREPMTLYYTFLPLASMLLGLGIGGALDVTARKSA